MSIQPNNTNLPLIQQALLTKDNRQVALHKRMPMYCDQPENKPLTMGVTIRKDSMVVFISGCIIHIHVCTRALDPLYAQ